MEIFPYVEKGVREKFKWLYFLGTLVLVKNTPTRKGLTLLKSQKFITIAKFYLWQDLNYYFRLLMWNCQWLLYCTKNVNFLIHRWEEFSEDYLVVLKRRGCPTLPILRKKKV